MPFILQLLPHLFPPIQFAQEYASHKTIDLRPILSILKGSTAQSTFQSTLINRQIDNECTQVSREGRLRGGTLTKLFHSSSKEDEGGKWGGGYFLRDRALQDIISLFNNLLPFVIQIHLGSCYLKKIIAATFQQKG